MGELFGGAGRRRHGDARARIDMSATCWFSLRYVIGSVVSAAVAFAFFLSSRWARTPVLQSQNRPATDVRDYEPETE